MKKMRSKAVIMRDVKEALEGGNDNRAIAETLGLLVEVMLDMRESDKEYLENQRREYRGFGVDADKIVDRTLSGLFGGRAQPALEEKQEASA